MAEARGSSVGDNELDLLKLLWDEGPGTVRELNARARRLGRRWAYTTVLTMLQRLEAKGLVDSDKRGLAHVFRPTVTRVAFMQQRLKDLAKQLGERTTTPLVLALVGEQRFTAEEIERFRQLLDELESKQTRGAGGKTKNPEAHRG